ncbi:MAG TPA: hypothetical protein V6D06_16275 [Trichocoleus sp.]
MAPSKLSDADKQTILELYRQPEETTSTLAERYGVSNSTISRLLKSQLPEAEYAALIQQKRAGEKATGAEAEVAPAAVAPPVAVTEPEPEPAPAAPAPALAEPEPEPESEPALAGPELPVEVEPVATEAPTVPPPRKIDPPRRRVRSEPAAPDVTAATQLPLLINKDEPKDELSSQVTSTSDYGLPPVGTPADEIDALPMAQEAAVAAVIGDNRAAESSYSEEDDLDDDLEDDLDDDYDDEDGEDFDDDEDLGNWKFSKEGTPQLQKVQITPLTPAALPRLCYVVVERNSSELVTCPLRDFAELGQIPEGEIDSRTLPVFDNHRVARRFSRRNQRVVKVPDGTMLQKTSPYLQAKGITRLLIDGQIYALETLPAISEDTDFEED